MLDCVFNFGVNFQFFQVESFQRERTFRNGRFGRDSTHRLHSATAGPGRLRHITQSAQLATSQIPRKKSLFLLWFCTFKSFIWLHLSVFFFCFFFSWTARIFASISRWNVGIQWQICLDTCRLEYTITTLQVREREREIEYAQVGQDATLFACLQNDSTKL